MFETRGSKVASKYYPIKKRNFCNEVFSTIFRETTMFKKGTIVPCCLNNKSITQTDNKIRSISSESISDVALTTKPRGIKMNIYNKFCDVIYHHPPHGMIMINFCQINRIKLFSRRIFTLHTDTNTLRLQINIILMHFAATSRNEYLNFGNANFIIRNTRYYVRSHRNQIFEISKEEISKSLDQIIKSL